MKQKKPIVKGTKVPKKETKKIKPIEAKVEAPIVEKPKIIVDNAEVLEILEENETKTAKLCRMSDGTQKYVENFRFDVKET
jgi:hypothetical protein